MLWPSDEYGFGDDWISARLVPEKNMTISRGAVPEDYSE
jgi:hypothetical protein